MVPPGRKLTEGGARFTKLVMAVMHQAETNLGKKKLRDNVRDRGSWVET